MTRSCERRLATLAKSLVPARLSSSRMLQVASCCRGGTFDVIHGLLSLQSSLAQTIKKVPLLYKYKGKGLEHCALHSRLTRLKEGTKLEERAPSRSDDQICSTINYRHGYYCKNNITRQSWVEFRQLVRQYGISHAALRRQVSTRREFNSWSLIVIADRSTTIFRSLAKVSIPVIFLPAIPTEIMFSASCGSP